MARVVSGTAGQWTQLGLEAVQSLSPEAVFRLRGAGEPVTVAGRTLPSTSTIAEHVDYARGDVSRLTSAQRATNLDAVQDTVTTARQTHTNVPADLANAVIAYESGGLTNAVSSTGALGIMQIWKRNSPRWTLLTKSTPLADKL